MVVAEGPTFLTIHGNHGMLIKELPMWLNKVCALSSEYIV